jgi:hypothetical protein
MVCPVCVHWQAIEMCGKDSRLRPSCDTSKLILMGHSRGAKISCLMAEQVRRMNFELLHAVALSGSLHIHYLEEKSKVNLAHASTVRGTLRLPCTCICKPCLAGATICQHSRALVGSGHAVSTCCQQALAVGDCWMHGVLDVCVEDPHVQGLVLRLLISGHTVNTCCQQSSAVDEPLGACMLDVCVQDPRVQGLVLVDPVDNSSFGPQGVGEHLNIFSADHDLDSALILLQ